MKSFSIQTILFTTLLFLFSHTNTYAQNNMGIGTTTPDASAILELSATDKGLLIPRVSLDNATTAAPVISPVEGLLIYNATGTEAHGFWYWDGTQWIQVGSGSGSGGTLDDAYNFGGAGLGRSIAADFGAVEITLSNTTNGTSALNVISTTGTSGAPSLGIIAQNTAFGGGIYSENTNTANPYNAIEGSTNSTNAYTSAVAGYYDGTGQGVGVYGSIFNTASTGVAGVMGVNNRTNGGFGVYGQGFNGGVGETNDAGGAGLWGQNNNGTGTGNACGVIGDGYYGVWGQTATGQAGTFGMNARTDGGWGVEGQGFNGTIGLTVQGQGYGVYGENMSTGVTYNNIGVAGLGWVGVWGETNDFTTPGYGVYANGDLGASGTKSFMIDHPLDPENKYLKHYSIESPEVLNIYRGLVTLDANGNATVTMPDYFEAINTNYSYNLTAIGSPAPNLFIKQEISNGKFVIAGGNPNMKVSWVVYAQRNDKYVQQYPNSTQVEIEKRNGNKGKYLIPELYNQPKEKAITYKPLLKNKTIINNESIKLKNIKQNRITK